MCGKRARRVEFASACTGWNDCETSSFQRTSRHFGLRARPGILRNQRSEFLACLRENSNERLVGRGFAARFRSSVAGTRDPKREPARGLSNLEQVELVKLNEKRISVQLTVNVKVYVFHENEMENNKYIHCITVYNIILFYLVTILHYVIVGTSQERFQGPITE